MVGPQPRHRLGIYSDDLPSKFAGESPQIVEHEHREIVIPVAQGRQMDGENTQPIVQVCANLPSAESALRSRWVAAISRTLVRTVSLPPTR